MTGLPEKIYFQIFSKIPLKSILACKCVCWTWHSLISNPDFVRMQLNLSIQRNTPSLMLQGSEKNRSNDVFYSVGHDSLSSTDQFLEYPKELDYPFRSLGYTVTLMGSCDGLVCLWFWERKLFCLWNPVTKDFKILPKSNIDCVSMVAFGYDYKSNDYKLLAGSESLSEVCLLGINSWRRIENVPYNPYSWKKSGVFVNGKFHWLAYRKPEESHVLVSLDITNEIFKEIQLPGPDDSDTIFYNLGVLEGSLCVLGSHMDHVKIWVMQNYGATESWTNRYIVRNIRIADDPDMSLMWSFKNGEILFRGKDDVVVYNAKDGRVRDRDVSSLTFLYQGEPYFESLVWLKSKTHGEKNKLIEEPSNKKRRINPLEEDIQDAE